MKGTVTAKAKENGSVLVITALALFLLMGMAGLAIDLSHSFSNKTRLQNSVDAAAIGAAMKLLKDLQDNLGSNTPVSTANANAAGTATHQANLNAFGSSWVTSPSAIEFCWTRNLQDFSNCQSVVNFSALTPGSDPVFFVRARVASSTLSNFFMQVMGMGNTRSVNAIAVAGTSSNNFKCNIAPFFVCDNSSGATDTDCSNDTSGGDGKPDCFGNRVTTSSNINNTELNEFLNSDDLATTTVNERSMDLSNHFFVLKVGSSNPPATPTSTCPSTTPFETNNCVVVKEWSATNNPATAVNESDTVNGYPIVINRATQNQWSFNQGVTLNGNFGYLELININGGDTNSGAPAMKYNLLQPNACIQGNTVASQTGNISSLDAAFNALFGLPKPPYSSGGNPMPLPIDSYADFVANSAGYTGVYQPVTFNFYRMKYRNNPSWTDDSSHYHQRLRNVPVIQCPNPLSGNQPSLTVKGYACFFFSRKMYDVKKNPDNTDTGILTNNEDWVIAEHVDRRFCPPIVGAGPGTPVSVLDANIILYQYYGSVDS